MQSCKTLDKWYKAGQNPRYQEIVSFHRMIATINRQFVKLLQTQAQTTTLWRKYWYSVALI